jgi:hypothetical protein
MAEVESKLYLANQQGSAVSMEPMLRVQDADHLADLRF